MKRLITAVVLMIGVMAGMSQSLTVTNTYSATPNVGIPDGTPVGVIQQFNLSGVWGVVSSVTVALDITGGFNGDLYAYLMGPQGQVVVLLNRPGISGGNPIGWSDSGLNIVLDQSASGNIHNYGNLGYSTNGSGQVTGTWLPDGRLIDPNSAGNVFDGAGTLADLSLLNGVNPNGMWTLFVADLGAGGGSATLHNVILTIMTVPEPQTWAMIGGGLATLFVLRRRKQ